MLFISTCPEPWGGSEELWARAALALREAGHPVDVLKTVVRHDHPRVMALEAAGCRVRDLHRVVHPRPTYLVNLVAPSRFAIRDAGRHRAAVLAHLIRHRPRLAIVCQGENFDGVHLATCCSQARVPYVLVSQKASRLHWPNDRIRAQARDVYAAALGSVFVSHANLQLTADILGMDVRGATVLDNPVVIPWATEPPWPSDPDGLTRVACVGRLFVREKGQDLLLDVLSDPAWRARPIHVSIVGSGPHREGLAGLAARRGLTRVAFPGHVSDITAIWREHHALVMPSRAEGMPLALLEAMSCGRVPIVTQEAGAELVDDGVSGFLTAATTADGLAEAFERAWARLTDWPAIGSAARSSALARLAAPQETFAEYLRRVGDL